MGQFVYTDPHIRVNMFCRIRGSIGKQTYGSGSMCLFRMDPDPGAWFAWIRGSMRTKLACGSDTEHMDPDPGEQRKWIRGSTSNLPVDPDPHKVVRVDPLAHGSGTHARLVVNGCRFQIHDEQNFLQIFSDY